MPKGPAVDLGSCQPEASVAGTDFPPSSRRFFLVLGAISAASTIAYCAPTTTRTLRLGANSTGIRKRGNHKQQGSFQLSSAALPQTLGRPTAQPQIGGMKEL